MSTHNQKKFLTIFEKYSDCGYNSDIPVLTLNNFYKALSEIKRCRRGGVRKSVIIDEAGLSSASDTIHSLLINKRTVLYYRNRNGHYSVYESLQNLIDMEPSNQFCTEDELDTWLNQYQKEH